MENATAVIERHLTRKSQCGDKTVVRLSGPCLNIKTIFPGMGIPMLKIRQSWDRLIFNMGIPILVRWHLYLTRPPDLHNGISYLDSEALWHQTPWISRVMACCLFSAKPIPESMMTYCHHNTLRNTFQWNVFAIPTFFFKKMHLKLSPAKCWPFCLGFDMLSPLLNTLRPGKMAAIFQTTFSNAFSSMKMCEFLLKFHWSLFLGVQLTIFQHWFR